MSVRIYPAVKTEPFCDDYSVKVNGLEIDTNTARVSAMPFNRRWPGHQRDISQSEAVQFVSLATDEALEFEITPKNSFENVSNNTLVANFTNSVNKCHCYKCQRKIGKSKNELC